MIDPIIFTIRIGNLEWPLHWYGVIVMIGVIVGSLIVERELKRRGENGDRIWDALIWVLPAGIVGARLWYVTNATIGGNRYYIENPVQIINTLAGGLHIFGGFLLGSIALLYYLRRNNLDVWLFLDAAGPAALIGQGIGRIANFINQELYGPTTTLPWGIPISAEHRLPQFADLPESTRFHPTFAYEMLWNFLAAGLLLWISRRYEKDLKPGTIFSGWLLLAGIGRVIIEFFRPDQPKIESLGSSYSALVAALMAVAGAVMLMLRYRVIDWQVAQNWQEEYRPSLQPQVESTSGLGTTVVESPVVRGVASTVSKRKTATTSKKTTTKKPDRTPDIETQTSVRSKRTSKSENGKASKQSK